MISVLVLAAGIQESGSAMDREAWKMPAGRHAPASFFAELDLTKEQREQIAALQKKHFQATSPLHQKMREAVFAYRQTMVLHPDDQAALAIKRQAIEEARRALHQKRAEFREEFERILTPAQRAKQRDAGFGEGVGWKGHGRRSGCGR